MGNVSCMRCASCYADIMRIPGIRDATIELLACLPALLAARNEYSSARSTDEEPKTTGAHVTLIILIILITQQPKNPKNPN